MIVEAIMNVIYNPLYAVMDSLPSLPSFPADITNAVDYLMDLMGSVIGIVKYFYSPALFVAIMVLGSALIFFDVIVKLVLFVIKKIPFLGMS